MQQRIIHAACAALAFLVVGGGGARAQCALPYQLTNGQVADATQVMANYNALLTKAPHKQVNSDMVNSIEDTLTCRMCPTA